MNQSGKNKILVLALVGCVAGMIAVAYASVPLYRLFCSATGFGGTTQRVAFNDTNPSARVVAKPDAKERWVTITFDGNVDKALPWEFGPDTKSVRVKLGQVTNVTYHARNLSDKPVVGTATFNVQPDKIGSYFDKIQCFCFTKQILKPGESISLPVQFYVDPAMADDNQTSDVQNITLSYTFFRAKDQSKAHKTDPQPPAPENNP